MPGIGSGPNTALNDLLGAFLGAGSTPPTGFVPPFSAYRTDLLDIVTGRVIFRTEDANGQEVELFYNNDNGEKIVVSTGFTQASASAPVKETVYETLPTGAVERVNQFTSFDNVGNPQVPVFTLASDPATVYTPTGTVAEAPQRVALGTEQIDVTAAVASLPPVVVTNSEGQDFPQHAFIHVEVGGNVTASGIAYTTDGTDPVDGTGAVDPAANLFQISSGQGFDLDNNEQITGFRAVPIDLNGQPDLALVAELSVQYSNISADKDDV